MQELGEVLFHPSRWNDLSGVAPHNRILVSLTVLSITVVLSWIVGSLSSRWGRARAQKSGAVVNGGGRVAGPVADRIRRIRRALMLVTLFVGGYVAVEAAPLPARIESVLTGTLYVLGALTVARLLIHLITLLLTTSVAHVPGDDRARLEREYVPLAHKVSALAVTLILIIVVAKHFGQDVTSLVAALGVGSLAIGLAAQQTLGNMIAGFVLLVDRPFRPGDRIKLASGEAGEVIEIGVRSTRIVLENRNLLIVPNTELVNSRVVNYAFPAPSSRGEVRVQLAPGADVDRASAILCEAAGADEHVLKQPAPVAMVTALKPGMIELSIQFDAVQHADLSGVEERIRRKILRGFAAADVKMASLPVEVRTTGS